MHTEVGVLLKIRIFRRARVFERVRATGSIRVFGRVRDSPDRKAFLHAEDIFPLSDLCT